MSKSAAKQPSDVAECDVTCPAPNPEPAETATNSACCGDRCTCAEEEIRELAYAKWQAASCPPGDGVNFWLEAETELLTKQG